MFQAIYFQALSWAERAIQQAGYDPRIVSLDSLDILQVVEILQHLYLFWFPCQILIDDSGGVLQSQAQISVVRNWNLVDMYNMIYMYMYTIYIKVSYNHMHVHDTILCSPLPYNWNSLKFAEWVGWTLGVQLMSCSSLCDGGLWRPPVRYLCATCGRRWLRGNIETHRDQALARPLSYLIYFPTQNRRLPLGKVEFLSLLCLSFR